MIKKILVANRGEIACRVFKTAKAMGIATVAVYSDADKAALHVQMADEAVHIGAPAASESYLVIEKIIQACKQTGADAVHPGYGFLSERAEFAEALKKEGIIFVGPPVSAIEAMGDKITSKKIAAEAGVSTVPGYMGLIETPDHAARIAAEIGYPVMIKASAGGGGKGMRIAWNDAEAREGFERSKSEAASSFGDDRIFIEKFVEQPRHIEIQVLADTHGGCIYLGERECSIQRRNQKVVEEAPSPFLDAQTRAAMGDQAVALSKAVSYAGAGTVEFIVDKNRNFYFLEMNTRLQVEHPVTELITGVDLVEQMIRVASGEALSLRQEDVKLTGWAMESRLYSEDPYRNFLPSIGRLTRYRPPAERNVKADPAQGPAVRNDTGVYEGGEISMFYDPMIAKLCSWGRDRAEAINTMVDALDRFEVEGVGHNLPFLSAVMGHEKFRSGNITTAFIAEEYPEGFQGVSLSGPEIKALACFAAAMRLRDAEREMHQGALTTGARSASQTALYTVLIAKEAIDVSIKSVDENVFEVRLGDEAQKRHVSCSYTPGDKTAACSAADFPGPAGAEYFVKVDRAAAGYRLRCRGADLEVRPLSQRIAQLSMLMPEKAAPDMSAMLLCPMPGLLVKLHVKPGDHVEEGQALAIVEAMKMENVLRAEKAGVVARVPTSEGDSLALDEVILEFEK